MSANRPTSSRAAPEGSTRRASATRRWSSRRRARLVISYAVSRNRPWPKSYRIAAPADPGSSRTIPRLASSSRASTVSSSDRPLAARTVAKSNERPMTAAAERTWLVVSLTDVIRSRRIA